MYYHVIDEGDRSLFTRCRRAWDLGARTRRDYEPLAPPARLDLDRAVRDAMAVYYFPGMWDWQPPVVLPVVRQAFQRAMSQQRGRLGPEREPEWAAERQVGERLLESYFGWAPDIDVFSPIRVEADLEVPVPDPDEPERDVLTSTGEGVRYRTRLDLLAVDELHDYWVVEHRLVSGEWPDPEELIVDGRTLSWCWAWEQAFPGMRIVGTIHNQLRVDISHRWDRPQPITRNQVAQNRGAYVPPIGVAHDDLGGPRIVTEGDEEFRRTRIRRSRVEVAAVGTRIAQQAREMTHPALAIYPEPTPHNCAQCSYRRPCIAMSEGGDIAAVLAEGFRPRPPEEPEEGRLGGSTWSLGRGAAPPRFGSR